MQKLLIGAAALALLAGCGQEEVTVPAPEELGEVTVRAGNPAMAANALTAMSLSDSGDGVFTFAEKSVDGAIATFSDVTIAGADELTIGSMVLDGLDMTEAGASFGKLSLNDIAVTAPDEEGEFALAGIELTNPSPELAAWISGVLDDGEPDAEFPSAENLSFDSWSMSGLTGSFDDSGAEGTLGIESLEIRGVGDLKAKQASISGLNFDVLSLEDDMPFNMSLGSLSASNIDAEFVQAIQENIGDEDAMMSAIVSMVYDNPMDPGYDLVAMDDFKASVAGAMFEIPSINASVERNEAGQPVKYTTAPYTMKLTGDAEAGEFGAGLLEGLSVIGYESLEMSGASEASYDPDKDIVSFSAGDNYLELKDGAKFSFGGKVEGYSAYSQQVGSSFDFAELAEGGEPDPMAMTEALGALTFHNIELSIEDDSLVNRVINAVATESGQDPEQMKGQIAMGLGMAPMMVQGSGVDMALVTEATSALSSFISDPKTLTLKLSPSEPLSVASLMANPDPSALTKDMLGFSASND